MKYQVIIIKEPYHYYEKSKFVRDVLSETFKTQISGYKEYYPEGVCPISEYDFFTNHIILKDKTFDRVLLSCKIIKYNTCTKYAKIFPLLKMLKSLENPVYHREISKWLEMNPMTGYGHNWTIDPSLPKDIKKELTDITFALYGKFYTEEKDLSNMIDISITKFKIEKMKEWMGNSYFNNLPPFAVKEFANMPGVLMYNKGLNWSQEYIELIDKHYDLWDSRIEISKDNFEEVDIAA